MTELTQLETDVITAIILPLVHDHGNAVDVVRSLPIAGRTFSHDVSDHRKCSGFYLNFEPNYALTGIQSIPHHLSVQASHAGIPAGGDFIVFFNKDRTGIDYLEGTFFDYTLPVEELIASRHGFTLRLPAQEIS